jgi:NADH dehydrogenase FAD-containing subunit
MAEKIGVLILGSGFGGLCAALQFEKRNDPGFEATVVSRENFFRSRRCYRSIAFVRGFIKRTLSGLPSIISPEKAF